MKPIIKTLLLLILVTCVGCDASDDTIPINASDKLLGHWLNPVGNGLETQFERAKSLKNDAYGISFLIENNFIERSSGWCGTPPLVYADFRGDWEKDDAMITITIDNGMNGMESLNWRIKSLDDKHLIIERIP